MKQLDETTGKLLVSIDETAKILNLSPTIVRRLWHSEGFPAVRIGRRCLVSLAGLRNWVAEQGERTTSEGCQG